MVWIRRTRMENLPNLPKKKKLLHKRLKSKMKKNLRAKVRPKLRK
jgi:hypothetical protein